MKDKERLILNYIKQHTTLNLREEVYEYSRFDAQGKDNMGNNFIVELKHRDEHYDDFLLEFDKYVYNKEYAKRINASFLYAVSTENKIYIYNISDIDNVGIFRYRWRWENMPRSTEHGCNDKIKKFVTYLPTSLAIMEFDYD